MHSFWCLCMVCHSCPLCRNRWSWLEWLAISSEEVPALVEIERVPSLLLDWFLAKSRSEEVVHCRPSCLKPELGCAHFLPTKLDALCTWSSCRRFPWTDCPKWCTKWSHLSLSFHFSPFPFSGSLLTPHSWIILRFLHSFLDWLTPRALSSWWTAVNCFVLSSWNLLLLFHLTYHCLPFWILGSSHCSLVSSRDSDGLGVSLACPSFVPFNGILLLLPLLLQLILPPSLNSFNPLHSDAFPSSP